MVDVDESTIALMKAANISLDKAVAIIANLEAEGLTIYKKKVFVNGRRPTSSTPMSEALKAEIVEFYRLNPMLTQSKIAAIFNVNIGRVAEALSGNK